jgi:hypothetical protein
VLKQKKITQQFIKLMSGLFGRADEAFLVDKLRAVVDPYISVRCS